MLVVWRNRVVRLCSQNKVGRNELRSLVKELVERVLSIGSWFPEQDSSSSVIYDTTITSNRLSIRLHGQLLEVSREAVKVLVESYPKCLAKVYISADHESRLTERLSEFEH